MSVITIFIIYLCTIDYKDESYILRMNDVDSDERDTIKQQINQRKSNKFHV